MILWRVECRTGHTSGQEASSKSPEQGKSESMARESVKDELREIFELLLPEEGPEDGGYAPCRDALAL